MQSLDDTIAALATPAGTSALAVIRVSGPDTKVLATALLGRPPLPRRVHRLDYRDRAGAVVDDVLCVFFAAPRSYSGDDSLELSVHGNPYIVQRVLDDLGARGCRPAAPGEFTQRAFLNGRMDLSQAEAVVDVIHARSERALAAANQQLRGALGRHVQAIVGRLVRALARIEAYIDFPEEDLPAEDRVAVARELEAARSEAGRLLATRRYGELLRDGIKTVIAGAPNVGKSSLLNRLVGHDRALVSAEPGTTRDFIEERILVGDHWLRLIDTAGLNDRPTEIEAMGIAKSYDRIAEADLVLAVCDASAPSPLWPEALAERLEPARSLLIGNKIDLSSASGSALRWRDRAVIECSAKTGAGFPALLQAIQEWADARRADTGEDLIAVNVRHAHALTVAGEALSAAVAKLGEASAPELLASDIRAALSALGEIVGRIDNERILDELFATFCIGK